MASVRHMEKYNMQAQPVRDVNGICVQTVNGHARVKDSQCSAEEVPGLDA